MKLTRVAFVRFNTSIRRFVSSFRTSREISRGVPRRGWRKEGIRAFRIFQTEREREKRNAVGFVKFRFRRDFIGEFCRKVSPQETEFVQFRTFRLNALACPVFLNLVYKLRNARASSPRSLSSRFVPRLILALCH